MSASPAATARASSPRWARWVTYGSVVVALIALVITVVSAGPREIFRHLIGIGPWFALILAIELLGTLCDAAALACCVGRGPSYWSVVRAQVGGRAVSLVTPLGSLGEVTKTTMLMNDVRTDRAIAAVARWNLTILGISLVAVVVGAPVCAVTLDLPTWLSAMLYAGSGVAGLLLIAGATLLRRGMLSSAIGLLGRMRILSKKRRAAWRKRLRSIDHHIRGKGSEPVGAKPIAWLVLARILTYVNVWVILAATGTVAGVGTMAAMATAGTVISWASTVVPMGLGVSEGGNAALFAALGEGAALGVTVVMTRRVVQLIYAAVGLSLVTTTGTIQKARAFKSARAGRGRAAKDVISAAPAAAAFPRAS